MEAFFRTVEDDHLRELLAVAIDGRGAFRRFREVIGRHPNEEDRWHNFKEEKMTKLAMEFLDSIGVEPAPDAKEKSRG